MYLHENAISAVLDVFGPERLSWVLGNTITMKEHDGRFSRSNKVWAQAMSIPIDRIVINLRTDQGLRAF
jgi:hypothetical protein